MVETVVFLTPHYVTFASAQAMRQLRDRARLVLLAYEGDRLDAGFLDHFHVVHRLPGAVDRNIRPILDEEACRRIVAGEVAHAGGPERLRIFCQEECHVLFAAELRSEFGIPGDRPDVVRVFRDKLLMKRAVARHGIKVPDHVALDLDRLRSDTAAYYDELRARLGGRIVLKPTSSAGSFQVAVVDTADQFTTAASAILSAEIRFSYEADSFIQGRMFQCDSFVRDGTVVFCGALELGCTNFDFVQGRPLSVFPALAPDLRRRLEEFNQTVITALGFRDGSTHHELFVEESSGELVFLEIAARVPGGIGVPFHERNSAINLIDANLYLTAAPDLLDGVRPLSRDTVVSALLPLRKGTIVRLNEPPVESRYEIAWTVEPGMVVDSRSLADNAGILTLYNDDREQLRRDFEALQSYVPVEAR